MVRRVPDETTGERLRRRADECRRTARVLLSRSDGSKTGQIYDIIGTQNLFGDESLFINVGHWANPASTSSPRRCGCSSRVACW